MKSKLLIISVILIFVSASCSPQQRVARIAEKYNLYSFDTVVYKDTIYITQKEYELITKIDSFGYFFYHTDTIIVKGRVRDSFIEIEIIIPPDTVYIEKKIETKSINIEKKKGFWQRIQDCFIIVVLLIGFVIVSVCWLKEKLKK